MDPPALTDWRDASQPLGEGPHVLAVEGLPSAAPDKLSTRNQLVLSVLWLSLNFQSGAFIALVIPAQILLFVTVGSAGSTAQALVLGELSFAGALITLIVQPLVGAISDRYSGALGRRRPYIAAGTVVLVLGIVVLALAQTMAAFVAGFILTQLGGAVATAAYQGLLPDRVPPEQRGAASGFMGLMTILGTLGSLVTAAIVLGSVTSQTPAADIQQAIRVYYALTAIILLAGALITVIGVDESTMEGEPSLSSSGIPDVPWRLNTWVAPWRHANFRWVFLTRMAVIMGLTLFMTYIAYYFARVSHLSQFVQSTAIVAALALLGAVLSALLVGIASDRTRRVPIVCVATTLMAAAALMFVLRPGEVPLIPLGLLFGLGFGAYTSVDWALAVDVLPSMRDAGKDMGLWSTASVLPALLAPAAGSVVIALSAALGHAELGYRLVFALATVCFGLGAGLILFVDELPRTNPTNILCPK
jgi:MFS family permease